MLLERLANDSDRDRLIDLYQHLHVNDEPFPDEIELEAAWKAFIGSPLVNCFVIGDDAELLSSCVLSVIPNLTRGCRPYGLIENVVTRTEFRGQGLAKRVLSKALDYAWEADCYKVMLLTGRKDEGVYRFYEKAGFSRHVKQAFIAHPPGWPT